MTGSTGLFRSSAFRRARLIARLTQTALAKEIPISRQRIGEWENGTAQPAPHTLQRLIEILDIKPSALVDTSTLRGKRYAAGLTQTEAARLFGTTRRRWGEWERGEASTQQLVAMDQALIRWQSYESTTGQPWSLRQRTRIEAAALDEATEVIETHHYLGRGRTMAQLPYWIVVDGIRVGVVLFSLPRIGKPLYGIEPMRLLELARVWITPRAQHHTIYDTKRRAHVLPIASVGIAMTLRAVRGDWYGKYPNLPPVAAAIAWADTTRHRGTIYKALNFTHMADSQEKAADRLQRATGGEQTDHPDCRRRKAAHLYRWKRPLTLRQLANAYQAWKGLRSARTERVLRNRRPYHLRAVACSSRSRRRGHPHSRCGC